MPEPDRRLRVSEGKNRAAVRQQGRREEEVEDPSSSRRTLLAS